MKNYGEHITLEIPEGMTVEEYCIESTFKNKEEKERHYRIIEKLGRNAAIMHDRIVKELFSKVFN